METTREVHRRSSCCHAEVFHPNPMSGNRLSHCLSLVCSSCGAPADNFEVVIGEDFVVWPLPKGFSAPKTPKRRSKRPQLDENPIPYPVHLPIKLFKRIILGII